MRLNVFRTEGIASRSPKRSSINADRVGEGRRSGLGPVAALIELTPNQQVAGPFPGTTPEWSGMVLLQETANRTLQDMGLCFSEQHPRDPRRWIWFGAALGRGAFHVGLNQVWRAQSDDSIEPRGLPGLERTAAPRGACLAGDQGDLSGSP